MTPRTAYTELLSETGWSLREWARRSGLSINTLRKLSAGKPGVHPQRRTLAALAAALRSSSARYTELADSLERSDPPPR